MKVLSSKKGSSLLRDRSVESIKSISWDGLAEEIQRKAPTLYGVLWACVSMKRRKRKRKGRPMKATKESPSDIAVLGVCTAILLRHHNQHMILLQRIIALILHSGHSSKQVS